MDIVGIEGTVRDASHVHTIDVWFSERRGKWVVERLNADGHHVGLAFLCASEADAEDCVAEWLRAHVETHLASPPSRKTAAKHTARQDRAA